jgi:hypothetical protein
MNTQTLKADVEMTTSGAQRKSIPLGQKIAFGVGMLANQMSGGARNFYGYFSSELRNEPRFVGSDFFPA